MHVLLDPIHYALFQMGYAKAGQNTGGIHLRLFSRAFIFEGSPGKRFVFVSIDAGMMDPMVKIKVRALL